MGQPLLRKIETAFAAAFTTAMSSAGHSTVTIAQGQDDETLTPPIVIVECSSASAAVAGLTQQTATMRVTLRSSPVTSTAANHEDQCATLENLLWMPASTITAINASATYDIYVYSVFPTGQNFRTDEQEWVWESEWAVTADHNQVT